MGLVRMIGEVLNDKEESIYLIHVLIIPKTKEGKHTKYLTTFRIVKHFIQVQADQLKSTHKDKKSNQ